MSFKFESEAFKSLIKELTILSENIALNPDQYSDTVKVLAPYMATANQVFNPNIDLTEFDTCTEYSRKQPVSDFTNVILKQLKVYKSSKKEEDLIYLLSLALNLFYVYFSEMKFRLGGFHQSIALEIESLSDFVIDYFKDHGNFKRYLQYAERDIPFAIVQEIFKSNEITNLGTLNKKLEEANIAIRKWEEDFEQKQNAVKELEERLENSKLTYDFVLLNEGFKKLYDEKNDSLKSQKWLNFFWIFLIVSLPIINLYIGKHLTDLNQYNWLNGLALVLPVITLMLLCLYFYRIGLQEKRSVQSQMMQLELRMALCQFIHNYADDSEKLHKKNEKGFEKFENIIFSPLVSSDDKIPTTFDGMEQLAKLVSEFRKQ